tara:strand:+ start:1200 stop:1490 length:291 start_codon:yes stop_codon:yes gene_type:complete
MNEKQFDEAYAEKGLGEEATRIRHFRDTGKNWHRADLPKIANAHRRGVMTATAGILEKAVKVGCETFSDFKHKDRGFYKIIRSNITKFFNEYGYRG